MATFIRKLFGHFGTKKDDHGHRRPVQRSEGESGGFGVKIAVPAETPIHIPVVAQTYGNGGIQGLKWYSEKLRVDDDGDVAQEFLNEVTPECMEAHNTGRPPRLVAVGKTKPAIIKGPLCTQDGNVHQYVESSSGNLWA